MLFPVHNFGAIVPAGRTVLRDTARMGSGAPDVRPAENARLNTTVTNRFQRTLAAPVELHGPGLFHGIETRLRMLPADEDSGLVFCRTDLADTPTVPARTRHVVKAHRRTVLGHNGQPLVETVEHLMAALAGLQIDNCCIELDAPEVPSFDGSSRVICDAILTAGMQAQTVPVRTLMVCGQETRVSAEGGQSIQLRPYLRPVLAMTWQLDYGPRALIAPQDYSLEITPASFFRDIASARTFVLESEIAALQKLGYGRDLTEKDLLIIGAGGVRNNQLRWPNECVRHKILDCVGDLALSGVCVCGHVAACRSGHRLNHQMAATLERLMTEDRPSLRTAA